MKPKIDFAFKEIMAEEQVRIGFLSAVLKLNPNDITVFFYRLWKFWQLNNMKLHLVGIKGMTGIFSQVETGIERFGIRTKTRNRAF